MGDLTKPEVRELAAEAMLPVATKRESMGVCFVGKRRSWKEFLSQYVKPHQGGSRPPDRGAWDACLPGDEGDECRALALPELFAAALIMGKVGKYATGVEGMKSRRRPSWLGPRPARFWTHRSSMPFGREELCLSATRALAA